MNKSTIFAAAVTGMMLASTSMADKHEKKPEAKKGAKPEAKKADAPAGDAMKKVHCFGINECKGKSECDVKDSHGCQGANDCKGKGWTTMTMKACTDGKGKIVD